MDWLGLSLVLVLYLLILLLALLSARSSSKETAEDLMLAGRGLGLFVGVATLVATEVGGAFVNGTAEEVRCNRQIRELARKLCACSFIFGECLNISWVYNLHVFLFRCFAAVSCGV